MPSAIAVILPVTALMPLGLSLQVRAFLDQGLEDLAALGLRLAEGTHAGQPDLLCRVLHRLGQLAVEQIVGRSGLACRHFLELLDHGVSFVADVGMCARDCCARETTIGAATHATWAFL
jgi:hypothetical protein